MLCSSCSTFVPLAINCQSLQELTRPALKHCQSTAKDDNTPQLSQKLCTALFAPPNILLRSGKSSVRLTGCPASSWRGAPASLWTRALRLCARGRAIRRCARAAAPTPPPPLATCGQMHSNVENNPEVRISHNKAVSRPKPRNCFTFQSPVVCAHLFCHKNSSANQIPAEKAESHHKTETRIGRKIEALCQQEV